MSVRLSIPARVNILGNPSDGNEGDYATISAAVDIRAYAIIEAGYYYSMVQGESDGVQVVFRPADLPLTYDGESDLLKAALNRLHGYSQEFREKLTKGGFQLRTWSDVPRQSGLGGSSLYVLLALAALRSFYELDPHIHNDYVLAELAQRAEEIELGITCGYADRYVPLFGGLAYLDYRGKLFHANLGEEPYATYERLDDFIGSLPLVAISTGVRHDSGDVHGQLRSRYLAEHKKWQQRGGDMPPMVSTMSAIGECAWRGKIALLRGDLPLFGQLMDENHRLVDEMMRQSGFEDGAGRANNLFIRSAKEFGALGAKLTGAGGGGSVFALVKPGEEEQLIKTWQKTIAAKDLPRARVFRLSISREGLTINHQ